MNTIIRLTLLEMLKKKILYMTLLMSVAFLALYGTVLHFAYQDAYIRTEAIMRVALISQLMSLGIYVTGFIVSFLSVFTSIGAISGEIEQGTLDAILAKPVARYEIILGRFIGILAMLLPYTTIMFLSVIGMNKVFGGDIMINMPPQSVIKSLLVLWILPILLSAIGLLFSTLFSTMGAGITLALLYFCAMVGGVMEQIGFFVTGGHAKAVLTNIGIITSLIIPSDVIYRKASSILFTTPSGLNLSIDALGGGIQPSNIMLLYIGIYIIFILGLSVNKFYSKDL